MLIAKEKKQNNIAEYILYMWQLEDLMRSFNFEMRLIEEKIIRQFKEPVSVVNQIRYWYQSLMEMMLAERITKRGHLRFITAHVADLNDLHIYLLNSPFELKYRNIYSKAQAYIQDYYDRMGGTAKNEIDICFNALYAWMLMRMSQTPLLPETEDAFQSFSTLIAMLAKRYHERERDELK